jgi:hypothetical protein
VSLGGAGLWWIQRPTAPEGPARPLTIVIAGDTAGWIVPCGCTSNQSGGLLRRGTHVKRLGEHADVVLADAGGAPGGTSPYQRVKLEAILKGELQMGLAVHNLGGPEAALGADYLRRVAAELRVPFVSANLRDARGELVADSLRVIERGGRHVAFTGVLSPRYAVPGVQVDDPREALLKVIGAARGRSDALVVLAYVPEEDLKSLAAALPEADAVVGGPTGQSIAPRAVGPTLMAAATNKGKFLIELDAAPAGGRMAWTGRVVEMGAELPDEPEQGENVKRYLAELARRDFAADDTGLPAPLPSGLPSDYRLAGTASCTSCHKDDCKSWEGSRHAQAWQTLAARHSEVDAYCQQCHTTGFGLPGGFVSAQRSPLAHSVGCESCHGPSLVHTRDPKARTPFLARDQCTRCHDRENSPRFDYAGYWQRIHHGTQTSAAPGTRRLVPE